MRRTLQTLKMRLNQYRKYEFDTIRLLKITIEETDNEMSFIGGSYSTYEAYKSTFNYVLNEKLSELDEENKDKVTKEVVEILNRTNTPYKIYKEEV